MTEEIKQVENLQEVQGEQKVEYSQTELKAIEQGWVPKDQFIGEEDSFVDAKEFLKRGELFDKIDKQSRELKAVKKALDSMKEHYSKVEEASYQRALKELKESQKEALQNGDLDKFHEIGDQIDEAKRQAEINKTIASRDFTPEAPPAPEFVAWTNRNPWYNSHKYMRDFADELGVTLYNQGVPKTEVLKRVEEEVRKEFPNKFINPNKENAPNVQSSKGQGTTRKAGDFEMTDEERRVMNSFIQSGALTKDEYIRDLKKIKGLA